MTRPALALAVVVLALGVPGSALAQGGVGGGWGLVPALGADGQPRSYFVLAAEPGQTLADAVIVEAGSEAVDVVLSAANAMASVNGGFVIDPSGGLDGPAAWIHLEATSLTLEAGTALSVPFQIVVPEGATPGVYDAALLSMRVVPDGGGGMRVDSGVGVAVSVLIAGPERCGMAIDNVTAEADILGRWHLVGSVLNDGSHPFRGMALATLAQPDGAPAGQWEQGVGYTCAGCALLFSIPLGDPTAGEYTGALALVGDTATTSCTSTWQDTIVIASSAIAAAEQAVDDLALTRPVMASSPTLLDRIAGSGGLLLALGLLCLTLALALVVVVIIKRRKGGR